MLYVITYIYIYTLYDIVDCIIYIYIAIFLVILHCLLYSVLPGKPVAYNFWATVNEVWAALGSSGLFSWAPWLSR